MKTFLRKVFWPLLKPFEANATPAGYRPSHRKVLLVVGVLFFVLSGVSVYFALQAGEPGALVPIVVFFGVGLVSLVVGALGSDGAVAKIWGQR